MLKRLFGKDIDVTSTDYISRKVKRIRKKFADLNLDDICKALKIRLRYEPLGNSDEACKGYYIVQSRIQMIVINGELPDMLKRCILAHELGHAVLHRRSAGVNTFHDFKLFDATSKFEYEANVFAAQLLLDDDEVLKLLNNDMSFFAAASTLGVPAELLDFKFRALKRQGFKVTEPPFTAQANFLRQIAPFGNCYFPNQIE